jgi:uroporphyrinogen-III synthase
LNSSVFISKSINEVAELNHFCKKNNLDLIAESLIRFEAIPFKIIGSYDVLFFASIRAAAFFLEKENIPSTVSIACIGQTTADKLIELGLSVDFIGEKSGNPEKVAEAFKSWLGMRKVLIPQSLVSKRSIALKIAPNQCIDVVVYNTIADCKIISACATYVFTSPSNFNSFLLCNQIPKGKIIAWGETTRKEILKNGLKVDHTLINSNPLELYSLL